MVHCLTKLLSLVVAWTHRDPTNQYSDSEGKGETNKNLHLNRLPR